MPLKPKNYRKAAKIVHASHMTYAGQRHQCCCIALLHSGKFGALLPPDPRFVDYFKPENKAPHEMWFGLTYWDFMNGDSIKATAKRMEHRVFALLLMAEISKDLE